MIESVIFDAQKTTHKQKRSRRVWDLYSEYKYRIERLVGFFTPYPYFQTCDDYDAALSRVHAALGIGKAVTNDSELCEPMLKTKAS